MSSSFIPFEKQKCQSVLFSDSYAFYCFREFKEESFIY